MMVLGIDPGLRFTGWGVVYSQNSRLQHKGHGVIAPPPDAPMAERLAYIFQKLQHVIENYTLTCAAVEEVFTTQYHLSTLRLGMARGVALMTPAVLGLPVYEYGANQIKKALVGSGHAHKDQIKKMVQTLLPGVQISKADAADALAVAICHAHSYRQYAAISVGG